MAHDLSNPHPEYGKNPNIKNEFGHTEYPKWVDGVIVKDAKEEAALKSKPASEIEKAKPKDWGKS